MIAGLVAWVALGSPQAAYQPGDIFLFPRSLSSPSLVETEDGVDRGNYVRARSALLQVLQDATRSLPPTSVRAQMASAAVKKLFAPSGNPWERGVIPPEHPLDEAMTGFWQSKYEFSLSGAVLGYRFEVFSSVRTEATYRMYRGYWVDYDVARVFFGAGSQLRFRIERPIFARSHRVFSPKFPATPSQRSGLVVELYGTDTPLLRKEALREDRYQDAMERPLGLVEGTFASRFAQNVAGVEPILVQLKEPEAKKYLRLSGVPPR